MDSGAVRTCSCATIPVSLATLTNTGQQGDDYLQNMNTHKPVNTILVVDDEPELLDVVVRSGYEVLGAGSPAAAVHICERAEVAVDLILSDFTLPETNGVELAQKIEVFRPNLPAIFMTGNLEAFDDLAARGFVCLKKPFSLPDLAGTIGEILAAAQSPRNS
jgi:CheY-like chemotaxis protein